MEGWKAEVHSSQTEHQDGLPPESIDDEDANNREGQVGTSNDDRHSFPKLIHILSSSEARFFHCSLKMMKGCVGCMLNVIPPEKVAWEAVNKTFTRVSIGLLSRGPVGSRRFLMGSKGRVGGCQFPRDLESNSPTPLKPLALLLPIGASESCTLPRLPSKPLWNRQTPTLLLPPLKNLSSYPQDPYKTNQYRPWLKFCL